MCRWKIRSRSLASVPSRLWMLPKALLRAFIFLDLFLGIFGSLALAVAFLGIVNTLVMAILERRREIGIMKALGASDGDVKRIFFVEAVSMGALEARSAWAWVG